MLDEIAHGAVTNLFVVFSVCHQRHTQCGCIAFSHTEDIEQAILNAKTITEVDDIYCPFRPKRKTRASVARERGLEDLAKLLLEQRKEYVPTIYSGAVKEAQVRNIATTYENADEILYNTVKAGIDNRDKVGLIDIREPITVEQTFTRTDYAEEILEKCEGDVVRVNARTLRKTIDKLTKYADLRF